MDIDKSLIKSFVRVTERAAYGASLHKGKNDKVAADQSAVDEMRIQLNKINMKGKIVIGEGEMDAAPMLYINELVGTNTGEEFVVEILSDGEVGDLNFTEELNYLGFNTSKENQIFALKIPLDLLLSPYYVYVTEFDQEILVESDKIRKTEYGQTDTHANLSFRPMIEGVIHVVGSSQMEHEEFLD